MKKLVLKAQNIGIVEDKYVIVVSEQTHRGIDFGMVYGDYYFHASNGLFLKSDQYLMFSPSTNSLYLRGTEFSRDSEMIFVNSKELEKIKVAVKEYNEYFKEDAENTEKDLGVITIQ